MQIGFPWIENECLFWTWDAGVRALATRIDIEVDEHVIFCGEREGVLV